MLERIETSETTRSTAAELRDSLSFEALLGQIFLVTVVSRLVSLYTGTRRAVEAAAAPSEPLLTVAAEVSAAASPSTVPPPPVESVMEERARGPRRGCARC